MDFDIGEVSLLGNRDNNQDRYATVVEGNRVLLALADGMGGHPRGEAAAQILVGSCEREFRNTAETPTDPAAFLDYLLGRAHRAVSAYGDAYTPPIDPRTTAVVALIDSGTAGWAHVGDSRCYLFRDGRIIARTQDHSYVETLRQQGLLSASECRTHPCRNYVTRCIGGRTPLEPNLSVPTRLQAGDILMLCSDGLWGPIEETAMEEIMGSGRPMGETLMVMAREAFRLGQPESDNITAVALRWPG